ncbi:MAG: hypothetical protein QG629_338 [Patescibacteria group bacterium]|nr:hypothetical protein [Candidatus Saccharibacteria bacterium]MDQ5963256.1 hypothetical protein [Patescibacteria group bacterium]
MDIRKIKRERARNLLIVCALVFVSLGLFAVKGDGESSSREVQNNQSGMAPLLATLDAPIVDTMNTAKPRIYFFWGDGCPYSDDMAKFFTSINLTRGQKYTLQSLEVWNNDDNDELMKDMGLSLGADTSGVPLLVVGDKTFDGYTADMNDDILAAIDKLSFASEPYDVYTTVRPISLDD